MMSTVFRTPNLIIHGEHALTNAKKALSSCGTKALIVTDKTMIKLKHLDRLTLLLDENGQQYTIYSEIITEPNDMMIIEGKKIYQQHLCDFIIALGGGAAIDAMKAIALMNTSNLPLAAYMKKAIETPLVPMVAIPTTAGTGSEATMFTIITDTSTQVKMLLKGCSLIPTIAIVDPIFTQSAPKQVTAQTGLDALCHAIEAYISIQAQPLSDLFALSAAKRILTSLTKAYHTPYDMEVRSQLSLAALEAGIAFNNSSVTLIHGMSRPIGALFHVPHGLSNAMLMEKCLQFMAKAAEPKFAHLARFCEISTSSSDQQAAEDLMLSLTHLLHDLDIPTMKAYGIDQNAYFDAVFKMADDAIISGSSANAPLPITQADILALYRDIYA